LHFQVETATFEAMMQPARPMGFTFRLFPAVLLVLFLAPLVLLVPARAEGLDTLIIKPLFAAGQDLRWGGIVHRPLRRPKVGLVLSGGGARGAAQVGVLKAFEKHGVPVDFVAATSMGAIVGGLYAAGWTPAEIESMATSTDWDYVLSLSSETERSDIFVDQRLAGERSFLTLRFEGLDLVIPSAVSSGQRLTTFLSTLTLQATYHPSPSFDDLRIPFRAVATDLVSGRRIVLREGSLAEALRASSTVPLLFNPVEKDGMLLVDGGLVDNIPVDVAEEAGCDLIIVVNTASGMRTTEQMNAPWEVADQIMGIMMQRVKEQQLRMADVVISPRLGGHLSTDFHGLDTLIRLGEEAADARIAEILRVYEQKKNQFASPGSGNFDRTLPGAGIEWQGAPPPDSLRLHISGEANLRPVAVQDVQEHVNLLYETGAYSEVSAEVLPDIQSTRIVFHLIANPPVTDIIIEGCQRVPSSEIKGELRGLVGLPFNSETTTSGIERVLRVYRRHGYSLARCDSVTFDQPRGALRLLINEGVIARVGVEGGVRTKDSFVLSDFPLEAGEVFEIEKARRGLANINGSQLFEYVYLEVTYEQARPVLTIRLKERPSQLMRFGLRLDNERKIQGSLDVRDENFRGTGHELGFTMLGGERNFDAFAEYKGRRLFDSDFSFSLSAMYQSWDTYLYTDGPPPAPNHWERVQAGEYSDIRYGLKFSFGGNLERLGNASIDYLLQNVRTANIQNCENLEDRFVLSMIRIGTVIDTKNRYPFPTKGLNLGLSFEVASEALGGSVMYNAFRGTYEWYSTIVGKLVLHPRITVGFADKTMPLAQEFRLGGRESMFGVQEDDRRGRQLFLINLELRQGLPFKIFFDTYIRLRFDLGTISEVPEALKLSTFRQGIGLEIALDTPIGPALFGAGKGFYFSKDLPENPVQAGPLLLYFCIGYQLF
jgi:NTE family protein